MEIFSTLHWPAIAGATIVAFVLGNIWFHPRVFGATWAKAAGAIIGLVQ